MLLVCCYVLERIRCYLTAFVITEMCTVCSEIGCLLNPELTQCGPTELFCFIDVVDNASGRHVSRGLVYHVYSNVIIKVKRCYSRFHFHALDYCQ